MSEHMSDRFWFDAIISHVVLVAGGVDLCVCVYMETVTKFNCFWVYKRGRTTFSSMLAIMFVACSIALRNFGFHFAKNKETHTKLIWSFDWNCKTWTFFSRSPSLALSQWKMIQQNFRIEYYVRQKVNVSALFQSMLNSIKQTQLAQSLRYSIRSPQNITFFR